MSSTSPPPAPPAISTADATIETKDFEPDSLTSPTSPRGVHYDVEAALDARREEREGRSVDGRGSAEVSPFSTSYIWG